MNVATKNIIGWGLIIVGTYFLILNLTQDTPGPWYLACTDNTKQQYLLTVKDKPVIKDGLIHIGNDTFITPIAGMTCRIVRVKQAEDEVKAKVSEIQV